MAPHSSTLAWKIPWMEEPGRLQSMGSRRVGHDWATSLSLFTLMHWRRKWQPTPVFWPGESQGWGSLVGCHLWGRTESDTTEVTQQQQQQATTCTKTPKLQKHQSEHFPQGRHQTLHCKVSPVDLFNSWLFWDVHLFAVQLVMGQTSLASVPVNLLLADKLASIYHSLGNLLPQHAVPLASFLAPNITFPHLQTAG